MKSNLDEALRLTPLWVIILTLIIFVCSGCIWEPFNSLDAEANCSTNNWYITANFASGKTLSYKQRPGDSMRYQRTSASEPMPILKSIVVVLDDTSPVKYSLSSNDLDKLRTAGDGRVILIISDNGLVCLDPSLVQKTAHQESGNYQSQEDYIRFLKNAEGPSSQWMRRVLTSDSKGDNP